MCTELFLAIIYFLTIFVVNFFLLKLLINYISNFLYLLKLKTILDSYPKEKISFLANIYLYSKNQNFNSKLIPIFSQLISTKDVILIGNFYNFLFENLNQTNSYYFQLLRNQYLSIKIENKK